MANILVACEFSGVVRDAFVRQGHYAMSCDLLPCDSNFEHKNAVHYQGDIEDLLKDNRLHWDLLIAHPPCTYLTNAGVRHLHSNVKSKNGVVAKISGEARRTKMYEACDFFNTLLNVNISRICVENPIPHCYARAKIGKYTQIIQPWMFGHPETKATCLWLKNLPKLIETKNVKDLMLSLPKKERHKIHYMSPSKDRAKLRSITYLGIAEAMAAQWGPLL